MMMLNLKGTEQYIIELVATVLPCLCIAVVLFIMIMYDFGLKQRLCGTKIISSTPTSTQIQPVDPNSNEAVPETQVVPAPPPHTENETANENEAANEKEINAEHQALTKEDPVC